MSDKWEWRKRLRNSDDLKFIRKHKNHLACDAVTVMIKRSPRTIQRVFSFAFSVVASVTPAVPIDLKHLSRRSRGWAVFGYGYCAALIFCFGVTSLLAIHAGTWYGSDPNLKYFSQDLPNILNYLFICPTYVGFCFWMIYLFIARYSSISTLAHKIEGEAISTTDQTGGHAKRASLKWIYSINGYIPQFFWFLSAATLFTAALTYNYITDLLHKENRFRDYWFMTTINGMRYLNSVGVYYTLLNFMLLFISVLAVLCFASLFIETVRIGDAISDLKRESDLTQVMLKHSLEAFTEAYIVAKCLCAAYIANIFLWQPSPLGRTWNLAVALFFVLVMGLFFISFPRYYVELMWYKYSRRLTHSDKLEDIPSLHNSAEDVWIPWIDRFFIGGCLTKFVIAPYFGPAIALVKGWFAHFVTALGN